MAPHARPELWLRDLARNIKTISRYFSRPAVKVCGLAMGWGRVIPGEFTYRVEHAIPVGIFLLIPEEEGGFTLPHPVLRKLADRYRIPALVPRSAHEDFYRAEVEAAITSWNLGDPRDPLDRPLPGDDPFLRSWFSAEESWAEEDGKKLQVAPGARFRDAPRHLGGRAPSLTWPLVGTCSAKKKVPPLAI